MVETDTIQIEDPDLVPIGTLTLVGLHINIKDNSRRILPELWKRLNQFVHPYQRSPEVYGVVSGREADEDEFEYLLGIEATDTETLPPGFSLLRIPAQRYAVFTLTDIDHSVGQTIDTIWNNWLPQSGYVPAQAPSLIEVYGEGFDPVAQKGNLEIRIPVR